MGIVVGKKMKKPSWELFIVSVLIFQNLNRIWLQLEYVLKSILMVVSNEINEAIGRLMWLHEIKSATFQLRATKASGLDGFSKIFYQWYLHIMGESMEDTIIDFFTTSNIPSTLNLIEVVLILKVLFPQEVRYFHPVSLCNFLKLIVDSWLIG